LAKCLLSAESGQVIFLKFTLMIKIEILYAVTQNSHLNISNRRYIKIVGTHNTVNRMFHVVQVQAFYTKKDFVVDPALGLLCESYIFFRKKLVHTQSS